MKYCPKCKKLYSDEDEVCSGEKCRHKALRSLDDVTTPVFLCTADLIDRDRIQAALEDSSIPSVYTRRMVSANSQLLTGVDYDGFDILVPYELYEKAYDVAVGVGAIEPDGEKIEFNENEIADAEDEEEPPMSRAKRTTVRIISAIILIIIFAGVIYGTDAIVNFIKSLFK